MDWLKLKSLEVPENPAENAPVVQPQKAPMGCQPITYFRVRVMIAAMPAAKAIWPANTT
jgi:hypothetical protein